MQPLLTKLLNLPGIDVETYRMVGDSLILEVEASTTEAICPHCQTSSSHLHQNHWRIVRDLSMSGQTVFLNVNRRQFKCHICGKPFSETLDFIGHRRKHTDRFADYIVQQVVHSDSHNVAIQNDLTDEEVWSMVQYVSQKN